VRDAPIPVHLIVVQCRDEINDSRVALTCDVQIRVTRKKMSVRKIPGAKKMKNDFSVRKKKIPVHKNFKTQKFLFMFASATC